MSSRDGAAPVPMPPTQILQRLNGGGRSSRGRTAREKFSLPAFCPASQEKAMRLLSRCIVTMIGVRRPTKESKP